MDELSASNKENGGAAPVPYERWIWIELIGFDKEQPDYAVQAYLDRTGFTPDSVSLLLYTPDFVHGHKGMASEWRLPMEMCSYGARPYSKDRARQPWTNYELRSLVAELQKHGIEVYCAFFDIFQFDGEDGSEELTKSAWCEAHPELYEMRKTGEPFPGINPLRRMKDGSYYEDLFVPELIQVLEDYRFDGYHGADGYTSPRLSLAETDYSDDMVGQFCQWSGEALPGELPMACDSDPDAMERRADWIWSNRRLPWIAFHSDRWAQLWHKIMAGIRRVGKKAYVNTAWTREPFEALYRYGVDYKKLADTGIDGFIVETVGASLSAGAGETEYEPGTEFMAMLLMIKAYVPNTKLICLNALADTHEQWDAINHAPTVLERDIHTLTNMYIIEKGEPTRCAAGFMACLGDGISKEDWKWITARWNLGFAARPQYIVGAALVWSDAMLQASLQEYAELRTWPAHKYAHELLSRGAPVHSAIRIESVPAFEGPILVTNLHLLSEGELQSVLAYRGGVAILIGCLTERVATALRQWDIHQGHNVGQQICVIRADAAGTDSFHFMEEHHAEAQGWTTGPAPLVDAIPWIKSLSFRPVAESFLARAAAEINTVVQAPKVCKNEAFIGVAALELTDDCQRLLLTNTHINYKSAHVDMGKPIQRIEVVTEFPGVPVKPHGSAFRLYVPGRGAVIVDVHL
ncbi:hypothetical protein PA598K_05912 [Paenibacillus sp. 598K]|uniref:hypothetical protein n=1 Tax=Paenibacillus sp. 598K TaxID=1117987 RepID=UPI000FF99C0D|nr:hypothetical protein [Paenibacillus sp. 598K]GBF77366.1 hypothetical protein PA598K_05912 [Paenibacillus sp. 598K]